MTGSTTVGGSSELRKGRQSRVGLLPGVACWIVPHCRREVLDCHDRILRPQPRYEGEQIQPEIAVLVTVAQPVVEVEAINVRDHGCHGTPQDMAWTWLIGPPTLARLTS